ncbi:hypothetical protein BSLG_007530 [Batrachochytrium salamandrivorans]|nr:hypothetical protein BSLG_007530 [Batrachochytrium salamandrivorans]
MHRQISTLAPLAPKAPKASMASSQPHTPVLQPLSSMSWLPSRTKRTAADATDAADTAYTAYPADTVDAVQASYQPLSPTTPELTSTMPPVLAFNDGELTGLTGLASVQRPAWIKRSSAHIAAVVTAMPATSSQTLALGRCIYLRRVSGRHSRTANSHAAAKLPTLAVLETPPPTHISCVSVSPDGLHVYAGAQDGSIHTWPLQTVRQEQAAKGLVDDDPLSPSSVQAHSDPNSSHHRVFVGHTKSVTCIQAVGAVLLSSSEDSTVMIWDTADASLIRTIRAHSGGATAVCFTEGLLYSGGQDSIINAWSLKNGRRKWVMSGHTGRISAIAVSPAHPHRLFSSAFDYSIRIWDTGSGRLLSAGWPPGLYNSISLWDRQSQVLIMSSSKDSTAALTSFAVTADGSLMLGGSLNSHVKVWDLASIAAAASVPTLHGFGDLSSLNGISFPTPPLSPPKRDLHLASWSAVGSSSNLSSQLHSDEGLQIRTNLGSDNHSTSVHRHSSRQGYARSRPRSQAASHAVQQLESERLAASKLIQTKSALTVCETELQATRTGYDDDLVDESLLPPPERNWDFDSDWDSDGDTAPTTSWWRKDATQHEPAWSRKAILQPYFSTPADSPSPLSAKSSKRFSFSFDLNQTFVPSSTSSDRGLASSTAVPGSDVMAPSMETSNMHLATLSLDTSHESIIKPDPTCLTPDPHLGMTSSTQSMSQMPAMPVQGKPSHSPSQEWTGSSDSDSRRSERRPCSSQLSEVKKARRSARISLSMNPNSAPLQSDMSDLESSLASVQVKRASVRVSNYHAPSLHSSSWLQPFQSHAAFSDVRSIQGSSMSDISQQSGNEGSLRSDSSTSGIERHMATVHHPSDGEKPVSSDASPASNRVSLDSVSDNVRPQSPRSHHSGLDLITDSTTATEWKKDPRDVQVLEDFFNSESGGDVSDIEYKGTTTCVAKPSAKQRRHTLLGAPTQDVEVYSAHQQQTADYYSVPQVISVCS